jgi:hypothetical protein
MQGRLHIDYLNLFATHDDDRWRVALFATSKNTLCATKNHSQDGCTALMLAAAKGDASMVNLLMMLKSDKRLQNQVCIHLFFSQPSYDS